MMQPASRGYLLQRRGPYIGRVPPLDPDSPGLADYLKREQQFQRIVAVNAGLNVSYIATGLLLQHYAGDSRTRQFGSAVAVQGAFLLAFDSYLLFRSTRFQNRVMPILKTVASGSMALSDAQTVSVFPASLRGNSAPGSSQASGNPAVILMPGIRVAL